MYHSVTFIREDIDQERNSWDDWALIPTSRPIIAPPNVEFKFVTVPYSNEPIDLTNLKYGTRQGSFEFAIDLENLRIRWRDLEPNIWPELEQYTWLELERLSKGFESNSWIMAFKDFLDFLNGEKMKVVLEDDPTRYYEGRILVEKFDSGKDFSKIHVNYILEPYKRNIANPSIFSL